MVPGQVARPAVRPGDMGDGRDGRQRDRRLRADGGAVPPAEVRVRAIACVRAPDSSVVSRFLCGPEKNPSDL